MTTEHARGLDLSESRVLVTGGTSGIGLAIARGFCEAGAQVIVNGRDKNKGQAAADALCAEGYQADYMQADMSDISSVRNAVDSAAAALGGLDVLVNNAGGTGRGVIAEWDPNIWDYVMSLNLTGPAFAMQAAVKVMRDEGIHGSITNITSIAGRDHPAGLGAYAASKAALNALTVVTAKEVARDGIRVNAIAPGLVETDMTASLSEPVKTGLIKSIPLGRTMGAPEDIANTCVFLASPAASYITGQVIAIDGGLRL